MTKNKIKSYLQKGYIGFYLRLSIFVSIYLFLSSQYTNIKAYFNQSYVLSDNPNLKLIFISFIAIFCLANKEKIQKIFPYRNGLLETISFSILALMIFLTPIEIFSKTLRIKPEISFFVLYALGMMAIFFAIFNFKILKNYFKEEIFVTIIALTPLLAIPLLIERNWQEVSQPFKYLVTGITNFLNLNLGVIDYKEGFIVKMGDFSAAVGPSCSGIYSIVGFSTLFFGMISFKRDDQKINTKNAAFALFGSIALLILINALRIVTIMFVGAHYSREIAINLFHEYFSSIFLLLIVVIFLKKVYPKLLVQNAKA